MTRMITRCTLLGAVATFSLASAANAQSFDLDALKAVLATNQSPLLASAEFADVSVESTGGSSTVTLLDVAYLGQSLDSLSFSIDEMPGADTLKISNVALPRTLTFDMDGESISADISDLKIEGAYDLAALAYHNVEMSGGTTVVTDGSGALNFELSNFASTNVFDAQTSVWTANGNLSELEVIVEDNGTRFEISIPSVATRQTIQGFADGANPLTTLGQQLELAIIPTVAADPEFEDLLPVVIGETSSQSAQFSAMTMTITEAETVTIEIGASAFISSFRNQLTPGEARGTMVFFADGISFADPAANSTGSAESFGFTFDVQNADYSQGIGNVTYDLYRDEPGTYAPFGDLIDALGTMKGRYSFKNVNFEAPNDSLAFSLDNLAMSFSSDTAQEQGGLGLGVDLSGVKIDGFAGPFIQSMLPETMNIDLKLDQVDMASLIQIFQNAERSGSINNDATVQRDLQALMPSLVEWWTGSNAVILPNMSYVAPATTLTLDGELPVDARAAYGLIGQANLSIADYDVLTENVSQGVNSESLEDQQAALSLSQALAFLGIFGDRQDDGSLTMALELSPNGALTINGIPLPF